jgi:hypothetical protein
MQLILGFVLAASASSAASSTFPPATTALPTFARKTHLVPTADPLNDRNDRFGVSVATDGDTLAVGVPGHDLPELEAGCVYVYERSGTVWV